MGILCFIHSSACILRMLRRKVYCLGSNINHQHFLNQHWPCIYHESRQLFPNTTTEYFLELWKILTVINSKIICQFESVQKKWQQKQRWVQSCRKWCCLAWNFHTKAIVNAIFGISNSKANRYPQQKSNLGMPRRTGTNLFVYGR